jgi:hypothetical protein
MTTAALFGGPKFHPVLMFQLLAFDHVLFTVPSQMYALVSVTVNVFVSAPRTFPRRPFVDRVRRRFLEGGRIQLQAGDGEGWLRVKGELTFTTPRSLGFVADLRRRIHFGYCSRPRVTSVKEVFERQSQAVGSLIRNFPWRLSRPRPFP